MKITTLIENSTVRHNLLSQHGQSLLIEHDNKKLLFDVGEVYEGFIYNLTQWGLSIEDIDAIIISHRHIDHIGSLPKIIPSLNNQKLYLPTQLGRPHKKPKGPKYVFIDGGKSEEYNLAIEPNLVDQIHTYPHVSIVDESIEILPNLWSTGSIGESMAEQSLIFDQKEFGLTIIVGCAHPGLEAIITKAQQVTGNQKIRSLIGGLHLNPLSDEEVVEQAEYLRELNLEGIFPNHCTGVRQSQILKKQLPDKVRFSKTYSVGTGNSVIIDQEIQIDFV